MLQIEEQRTPPVTTIGLRGRLDADTVSELDEAFHRLIVDGCSCVVIDLAHLEFVSSAGLRGFLSFAKSMKKSGGRFAFSSLTPGVRNVFEIVGFTDIFPMFDRREDAAQSVQGQDPS